MICRTLGLRGIQYFLLGFSLLMMSCGPLNRVASSNHNEKRMLFEMFSEAPTNSPSSRVLVLRVFSNDEIEYDTYPNKPSYPVKTELQSAYIDSGQTATISNLLKDLDAE